MIMAGWVAPALAGQLDMTNIPVLEKPALLPADGFVAKTDLYEETPYDDASLAYRVRLPKDWRKIDEAGGGDEKTLLSRNVIATVAEYASPARLQRRNFFTVEVQELTYEIGARNWFLNYIAGTGYTLRGVAPSEDENKSVEAAYVEVRGDITYEVRVTMIINGPRIVIARYFVPVQQTRQPDILALQEEELQMQAQVMQSFALTGEKLNQIEERATHGFLDQAYFDYPVSWALNAPKVINVERMRAMIFNPGIAGKMYGQINIYLTSRFIDTTMAKEVSLFLEKLNVPDYSVGGKIESRAMKVHENIETVQTEVYRMDPAKKYMQQYEMWVSVMQSEGYYFIVSMLTPARHADFYQWARNARAYEVVMETARQFDPTIDQYQYAD